MKQVQDQTGKIFFIPSAPKRIISLVPSLTELLFDLGLNDEVIGITKFCVHPEQWFTTKQRIGGTKNVDIALIQSLLPDLVFASKEENVKEQVEAIEKFCPVYCSDISDLQQSYEVIEHLGIITDRSAKANELTEAIQQQFAHPVFSTVPIQSAYLIWQKPYMTVGGDTFIHDMMLRAGFKNVFAGVKRYPEVSMQDLANSSAEVILFSSEPFPFAQKHLDEFAQHWLVKNPHQPLPLLKIVDGELFSWYGSRLLYSIKYFRKLYTELVNEI